MTRELSPKAAAALLRDAFAIKGSPIKHTEALDLVARLKGFNAWSHMQQNQGETSTPVAAQAPTETVTPKIASKFIGLSDVLAQHYGAEGEMPLFPRAAWREGFDFQNYWTWVETRIDEEGYHWGSTPFTFIRENQVAVTLPDGSASSWNIEQNLTSRCGMLNSYLAETKPGLAILTVDEPLLESLRSDMYDEITFLSRKDGNFGLYYEMEFCTVESEADDMEDYDDGQQFKPHAEVVAYLVESIAKLEPQFPGVEFCIPDAAHIINDRAAVWAFVKSGTLTEDQRADLGSALFDL